MDPDLLTLAALEHLPSVGLLAVAVVVLWRREARTTDRLVSTLEGQTTALAGKLGELKAAVEAGLAGLRERLEEHGRRLDQHRRRLDRHSALIRVAVAESGVRPRPQLVAEGAEDEHE